MSAIHDLIAQVSDPRLRERLATEWASASKEKKFGLVFEDHLPELLPLYKAKPRRGDLVCRRAGPIKDVWQVKQVRDGVATCIRPSSEQHPSEPNRTATDTVDMAVEELLVVREFGEPIFPSLVPMDAVQNGPADAPWHTLIEADNYHALQLLEYLYAGKVDCIYIDPPYNTGARDWKYNNDYVDGNDGWRHSKWLAFMEKRLRLAKRLLKSDDGVLIVTIDEHEVHHLGMLLEREFGDWGRQMVTAVINQKGVAQGRLSRVEEYALFCFAPGVTIPADYDDLLAPDRSGQKRFLRPRWERLQRGGNNATPDARPGLFYPVIIDPDRRRITSVGRPLPRGERPGKEDLGSNRIAWPIRRDGSYATWQVGPETLERLVGRGFVKLGGWDERRGTWTIMFLGAKAERQLAEGELVITGTDEKLGCVEVAYAVAEQRSIKTVWHRPLHDSGVYGSMLLKSVLAGNGKFSFPKSLYSTKDAVATVLRKKPRALVIDFFAGSGTTLHAVNLLNAIDGGERRCILVTNNEVSAEEGESLRARSLQSGDDEWEAQGICRSVTWPRSKYTILGQRDDGSMLGGEYFTGKTVERDKARSFRHIGFIDPATLTTAAKKQIVALIDGLPQTLVTEPCPYILSEDHKASVLFDPAAADDWLEALDGQEHISEFVIVVPTKRQFDQLKAQVNEILGPLKVNEEEKRPMREGFAANLAYFKLDFLDPERVSLRRAFREILPLLWLKSGAVGPRPELKRHEQEPAIFAPEGSNFVVLLDETRMGRLLKAIGDRSGLSHVFIVTDADESFKTMAQDVREAAEKANPGLQVVQLYRDYLLNFMINQNQDQARASTAGQAASGSARA